MTCSYIQLAIAGTIGIVILLLFLPIFFLSDDSFFLPIIFKILLEVSIFCSKVCS